MSEKRKAVIFDRDGTLASVAWCAPTDRRDDEQWRRFNALLPLDPVVPEVAGLLRAVRPGVTRLMTSGRMAGDQPSDSRRWWQVRAWLLKHDLPIDQLFMREGGDYRRDTVVKEELYRTKIEPHYDVRFAVDDRPEVCDLWRSLGIPVLQVTDPELVPLVLREDRLCHRCGVREGSERFYLPDPSRPYAALAGQQLKFSMKRTVGCDECWAEFTALREEAQRDGH